MSPPLAAWARGGLRGGWIRSKRNPRSGEGDLRNGWRIAHSPAPTGARPGKPWRTKTDLSRAHMGAGDGSMINCLIIVIIADRSRCSCRSDWTNDYAFPEDAGDQGIAFRDTTPVANQAAGFSGTRGRPGFSRPSVARGSFAGTFFLPPWGFAWARPGLPAPAWESFGLPEQTQAKAWKGGGRKSLKATRRAIAGYRFPGFCRGAGRPPKHEFGYRVPNCKLPRRYP